MTILALLIALLLAPIAAGAYTCTTADCTPTVTYAEPSTYVSGQPLTNLQDGLYSYQVNGGPTQQLVVPASRPQGGGTITNTTIKVPLTVCQTATVTGSIVARTTVGGVSAPAGHAPLLMDRTKLQNGQPDPQCTTPGAGSLTVQ